MKITLSNKKCACCHGFFESLHKHHVLPKVLGGVDEDSNIVDCCESCHGKIHGRDMLNHRALTIEGLKKAKAKGVKLGGARPEAEVRHEAVKAKSQANAERVRTILSNSRAAGMTYKGIAEELNKLGVATATGSGKWYDTTVRRYFVRLEKLKR